jgi:Zn-dependent alcohol dehydrogenase
MGEPVFAVDEKADVNIGGRFFGQSSLARHSIVSDKSIVSLAGLGLNKDDLRVLAPLGCGFQTGSGTVVNVARAGPDDCVTISGMGGVGLAAVIAAKNAGCKSLGATHTVDTSAPDVDMAHVVAQIKDAADGLGSTVSIDTSAFPPLVQAMIDATRYMGKVIQVGTGMPDAHLSIHMQTFMVSGKQYFGAVQGHSKTEEYIPQMIKWWRDGIFPVEKLVGTFDYKDFASAVEAMKTGSVVKPVILW